MPTFMDHLREFSRRGSEIHAYSWPPCDALTVENEIDGRLNRLLAIAFAAVVDEETATGRIEMLQRLADDLEQHAARSRNVAVTPGALAQTVATLRGWAQQIHDAGADGEARLDGGEHVHPVLRSILGAFAARTAGG